MNRLIINTNFAKVGSYLPTSTFLVEMIAKEDSAGYKYTVDQLNEKIKDYIPKVKEIVTIHQIEGEHVLDDLCLMLTSIYINDFEQFEDTMNEGRVSDFFFKKMPDAIKAMQSQDRHWKRKNAKVILSVDGSQNIEVPEFLAHNFINMLVDHYHQNSGDYKPMYNQNVGPEQIMRRSLAYAFCNYLDKETNLSKNQSFEPGKDLMKIAGFPFNTAAAFRKMVYEEEKRRSIHD